MTLERIPYGRSSAAISGNSAIWRTLGAAFSSAFRMGDILALRDKLPFRLGRPDDGNRPADKWRVRFRL
jgi:hypothetical protein